MVVKPTLSVVVPVYDGEATVSELADRLFRVFEGSGHSLELIFVDDDSHDQSWHVIADLATRDPRIKAIALMRNYGQQNATLAGLRAASGKTIVTMDDDLQHPPEEIPSLLAKLDEGYDVVYGTPEHSAHGRGRDVASFATKLALQGAVGVEIARKASPFRAFRSSLLEAFCRFRGPFVSIDVLLTWGSTKFAVVPVRHDPRRHGSSHYDLGRLVVHTLNLLTGVSTVPLQFASVLGFGLTAFGGVVLVYVIGRYLIEGGGVPGFPFLASIIAIFSGAQLFVLGVIGEYLARMHFRLMEKPTYVVRTTLGQLDGD